MTASSNVTLAELYRTHTGKVSDKWASYLAVYNRIFEPYRDKPVRLLEIGIQNGGSLEVWSKYFTNAMRLVGCDIDENCRQLTYADSRIAVVVGDACSEPTQATIFRPHRHWTSSLMTAPIDRVISCVALRNSSQGSPTAAFTLPKISTAAIGPTLMAACIIPFHPCRSSRGSSTS